MELTNEHWEALTKYYGDSLVDPDVYPKVFAHQLALWRYYEMKNTTDITETTTE